MTFSSRSFRRRIPSIALVFASIVAPGALSIAHADSAQSPRAEARARFDRGLHLYDDGDVAGALAEFKRAYDVLPSAGVLYNIAQAYAALGDPVQATDALDKLLASPGGVSPEMLQKAKAMRAAQAARVGEIDVVTATSGARIEVDNLESGLTPTKAPLRVSGGNHVIGLFAPGYAPSRQSITVAGGARAQAKFDLVPNEARLSHLEVRSRTPDAEVVANGETLGKTPLAASLTLLPGHYNLELRRPGYRTEHTEVTLGDGATGEVHLDLDEDPARSPANDGQFVLHASEPNAVLTVDGKLHGEFVAPLSLPSGLHRVRVERAGFLPSDHDVTLSAGHETDLRVHLYPTNDTREAYESSARARRTVGWIVTLSGVVVAGVSTGYFLGNRSSVTSAQNQFDDITARTVSGSGKDCDPLGAHATFSQAECLGMYTDASSRLDDAHTRQTIGIVGMGVGAATAITGVVLLLTAPDVHKYDHESISAKLAPTLHPFGFASPSGGSFGLAGTF